MRCIAALLALLLFSAPAWGAGRHVTFYLDAALVENEAAAARGYLELVLPAGMRSDSLRIRPLAGSGISRVEVVPALPGRKLEQELARLAERKESLQDRLKALETREEIFRAAAKSQSGKAPRKSKANPEPLAAIRQGTEFAIAQLEGVYRARRKAEQELKGVEGKVADLRRQGNVGGQLARVWLTERSGRVAYSYIMPQLHWTPLYDFRVSGTESAEVIISAIIPPADAAGTAAVVPFTLADVPADARPLPVAGTTARVAALTLPLDKARFSPALPSSLAFTVSNRSQQRLPAGEAACYWEGEYIGKVRFSGCLPGESRELEVGR